jgi:hypothetical protein
VQEAVVEAIKSHQTLEMVQKASGLVGRTLEDGHFQRRVKFRNGEPQNQDVRCIKTWHNMFEEKIDGNLFCHCQKK